MLQELYHFLRTILLRVSRRNLINLIEHSKDDLPVQERFLTWCDLFYLALCDVTQDKMVLITRYPIDSCYNQFPSKVNVYSTKKTEPMVVNGKFYKNYPYIRENLIGTNTTNLFIDTLGISNVYLASIVGDYKSSSHPRCSLR